ncbi:Non-syndromic hearing impairment protein 5 [Bagarius yarrelli]|uniref:Non-syndromic hearing impairment protein 5 n=1 Tax=Bagarius yarrelli TaxID=175774 RepID=A0A556TPX9_BAGYA|nr:Non-syndromic hearing impairment protein 5 [Bagarius yarrelli]
MFAKATKKFVEEIDPDGCLIPVSRLNETDNLNVLSFVIKRNRLWFWQKPKYIPTDFSIKDVLITETPWNPAVVETDFLKYNGTVANNTSGGAEADIGPGKLNVEGKALFKLASSFGNLKKQEVDVKTLLNDTRESRLNFQHSLLKQTLQRPREVFALVKERIVTTETCTVTEVVQEGGSCSAFLGILLPKKISVAVKNSSVLSDNNVLLEIPAKTALAYSIMELTVKSTGHFELCLLPDSHGSVEVDNKNSTNTTLVYSMPPKSPVQQLQQELNKLQSQFNELYRLPASTRSCLFQKIILFLKEKTVISILDLALEDLLDGRKPDLSTLDKMPALKEAAQSVLELLGGYVPREGVTLEQPSALTATELLTSALEVSLTHMPICFVEMNESTLSLFESCCHHTTLQALRILVQNVLENRESSLKDNRLAPLAEEDTYRKVQVLFESADMKLSKNGDSIQVQISRQQGHHSLILCIVILSLASLSSPTD